METKTENKFDIIFEFTTKSFEEVIQEITEQELTQGEEFVIKSNNMLSIIIGISGETNGRILLNTSIEYGRELTKAMNFGDEVETEDDLYMYLAEFANMFCGRTATHINNKFGKREIWISPPTIFSANDLDIITPNVSSRKAYYNCDLGLFTIDVGFSDSDYDGF